MNRRGILSALAALPFAPFRRPVAPGVMVRGIAGAAKFESLAIDVAENVAIRFTAQVDQSEVVAAFKMARAEMFRDGLGAGLSAKHINMLAEGETKAIVEQQMREHDLFDFGVAA